jgi:hypothetical protein
MSPSARRRASGSEFLMSVAPPRSVSIHIQHSGSAKGFTLLKMVLGRRAFRATLQTGTDSISDIPCIVFGASIRCRPEYP